MDTDTVFDRPSLHAASRYSILADTVCDYLLQRLTELQHIIGETPAELAHCMGSKPRQIYHVDPNCVFDYFDTISIDPAYLLEYVYHNGPYGGRPLLYTRRRFVAPFIQSREQYEFLFAGRQLPYLHHIKLQQTPRGVFEFLLFVHTLERMWCDPAKLDGVYQPLFTRQQRDQLIAFSESAWRETDVEKLRRLDVSPRIQMGDTSAVILVYHYSFDTGLWEIEYHVPYLADQLKMLSTELILPASTVPRTEDPARPPVDGESLDEPSWSTATVMLQ